MSEGSVLEIDKIIYRLSKEITESEFTNPLLRIFRPVTPSFIIQPLVPLYVAWFFFMIRFYLMPWILGYSVMGMLSFPLESEISRQIYQFFNSIKF